MPLFMLSRLVLRIWKVLSSLAFGCENMEVFLYLAGRRCDERLTDDEGTKPTEAYQTTADRDRERLRWLDVLTNSTCFLYELRCCLPPCVCYTAWNTHTHEPLRTDSQAAAHRNTAFCSPLDVCFSHFRSKTAAKHKRCETQPWMHYCWLLQPSKYWSESAPLAKYVYTCNEFDSGQILDATSKKSLQQQSELIRARMVMFASFFCLSVLCVARCCFNGSLQATKLKAAQCLLHQLHQNL